MTLSITVIVPAYNCADVISDAIESAWEQSVQPCEVIVVDDCSPDRERLEGVLEAWVQSGRVSLLRTPSNGGPAAARNLGVRHAKGELIAMLDADDRYEPNHLSAALAQFEQHPETALVCSDAFVEQQGLMMPATKNERLGSIEPVVTFERLLNANCVNTLTVVFRRDVFEELGPFDEDARFLGVEDYDLWLRFARRATIRYIDEPLCRYSITPGSLSGDPRRLFNGVGAIFDKLEAGGDLNAEQQSIIDERRRTMRVDLAYNLCALGAFDKARRAAWAALRKNPASLTPIRLLVKAILKQR